MMSHKLRTAVSLILIVLSGCSSLSPLLSTPTSGPVLESTATPQPVPTSTSTIQPTQRTLRVWLPPQFDIASETESAILLNQRFNDFEAEHPFVKIEVRIKGGNSDIVDYLTTTNSAAPESMPDLVALSYAQMQEVAPTGLLHPLDGLTNILEDPDWYAFARELSSVQNGRYGIPFAADAMVIVYRPSVFEMPPSDWESLVNSGAQMVFSASDIPQYFPLSLYLSANGQFKDEQGVFTLDEVTLVRVLSLFQQFHETETIPINIREFQTDVQSLNSYRNGESDLAVVWASSDIKINSGSYAALPGLDNAPYSIGDGWVWSLAGSQTEIQPLAADLATYLVESEFMSEWTRAAVYLPTRPLALEGWENDSLKDEVNGILLSSHPVASPDVVTAFGQIMQAALIRIFNGDQAEVVARTVMEELNK